MQFKCHDDLIPSASRVGEEGVDFLWPIMAISDDLAFTLHSIQVADEHRRAEARLQREQLMQADIGGMRGQSKGGVT